MRKLLIISLFLAANFQSKSQKDRADSLLEQIDNQQLIGVCHYFWMLEMHSPAGWDLIKIGKPATDRLVNLLTDSSKGIIAHYILSSIWLDSLRSGNSWARYNSKRIIDYTIGDLKFYWMNKMKAHPDDLLRCKENWIKFLANRNGH